MKNGEETLVIAMIVRVAELAQGGCPAGMFSFADIEGITTVLQTLGLHCFRAVHFVVKEQ